MHQCDEAAAALLGWILFMPVVILGFGAKTFCAVQEVFCLNNPDLYKRFL